MVAIVLGALLLRLVVAGMYRNRLSPGEVVKQPASEAEYLHKAYIEIGDSQQYQELAKNLRQKLFFSWDGKTPVTFRTPGYPIFLALIDNNPVLLFVLQSLFGALTVFFIFLIGAAWLGRRAGIVAAVLMALDLPAIAHTGMVMSETLFVFLLTVACWLFTVAGRKPAPVWGGLKRCRAGTGGTYPAGSAFCLVAFSRDTGIKRSLEAWAAFLFGICRNVWGLGGQELLSLPAAGVQFRM